MSIPIAGPISIFGLTIIPDFSTIENVKLAFYYLAVTLDGAQLCRPLPLVNSRIGHLCRSLQQNEELASSIGVNITYLRIIAYSISSFMGGISGAIFVAISQSIYPCKLPGQGLGGLHAQLLPGRARLRLRSDAWHLHHLFRLGPSVHHRQVSSF